LELTYVNEGAWPSVIIQAAIRAGVGPMPGVAAQVGTSGGTVGMHLWLLPVRPWRRADPVHCNRV